jgi:hypothetical protein
MDVLIDVDAMDGVARQVRRASAVLETERTLSSLASGAFGAVVVEAAYAQSARVLDAMTLSLGDDLAALADAVVDAAERMLGADAGLAGAVR